MPRRPVDLARLEPRRVCLIKPSSLGDVVHALPVLAALRDRWPEARFSWVVNQGLRGLVEGHPLLDEVIPFDRRSASLKPAGLAYVARFLASLRGRFDLTIDLQGLFRSGLMTAATGAPVRVGLARAREGATLAYTHRIGEPVHSAHAVDRLLEVARSLGADTSRPRFVPAIAEADRAWASETIASLPSPRLVLILGARWLTKRWPPARFAEVARRAALELGAGLVAVGAPEDALLVEELRSSLGSIPLLDLCGRTSLPQLAAVLEAADLVVSNDTGPLHLAAATGTRVVGIYTCTRPEWTGPYGSNAHVVRTGVPCAGSCVKSCSHLSCTRELDAARVWKVVEGLLRTPDALTPSAA